MPNILNSQLVPIVPQITSYTQNGFRIDTNNVQQPLGAGVQQPTTCVYTVIPAAAVDNFVVAGTAAALSGSQTLTTANSVSLNGQYPVVVLDCQRSLTVKTTATTTAIQTLTVTGFDDRFVAVTAKFTLPIGTVAGTYELGVGTGGGTTAISTTAKCFSYIAGVSLSTAGATGGGTISIGTGNRIGLPYFVPKSDYLFNLCWNSAVQAGTGPVFVPGFQFNPVANNPSPLLYPSNVTATTTDARGYVDLNQSTGAVLANGVRMLLASFYVYGADSFVQAQLTNQNASMIGQTGIGGYLNGNPSTPAKGPDGTNIISFNQFQLLAWDEVGAQFPGGY